jgi:hypothetical protein
MFSPSLTFRPGVVKGVVEVIILPSKYYRYVEHVEAEKFTAEWRLDKLLGHLPWNAGQRPRDGEKCVKCAMNVSWRTPDSTEKIFFIEGEGQAKLLRSVCCSEGCAAWATIFAATDGWAAENRSATSPKGVFEITLAKPDLIPEPADALPIPGALFRKSLRDWPRRGFREPDEPYDSEEYEPESDDEDRCIGFEEGVERVSEWMTQTRRGAVPAQLDEEMAYDSD